MKTTEQLADDYLGKVDDSFLACRAQEHNWPKLALKKGLLTYNKGIEVRKEKRGVYTINATCRDCGTVRTITTLSGGIMGATNKYTYTYPEGYRSPKGSGITRADCKIEFFERLGFND